MSIIKQVHGITWLVLIHWIKQVIDLEMSKCSLKIFMATLLIIRDLGPIIHRAMASESCPQSTKVWLV